MQTIKVFTKEEVKKIHANSSVYMYGYFADVLKVSKYENEYDQPEKQLALTYALDSKNETAAAEFKKDWKERLEKEAQEIIEKEQSLADKKARQVTQTKRLNEIKKLTSLKEIFEALSKM